MPLLKTRRSFKIIYLFLPVLVLGCWPFLQWVYGVVGLEKVHFEKVSQGVLFKMVAAQALVIRDETTLSMPFTGEWERMVEEGCRVAYNHPVITASQQEGVAGSETCKLTAPLAGIVCFHPDGLEKMLRPGSWQSLKMDKVYQEAVENAGKQNNNKEKPTPSGLKLAKVVNNLQPVELYLQIPKKSFNRALEPDTEIEIRFLTEDREMKKARILCWKGIKGTWEIVLEYRDCENRLHERLQPVEIAVEKYRGTIVPQSALVQGKEGPIVQVIGKDWIRTRNVDIIGSQDGKVAVCGLEENALVVVNPR